MNEIKESILYARRRIEEVPQAEIVDDIQWDDITQRWYIKICISDIDSNNDIIPKISMWYVTFPDTYPDGEVKVYPAVEGGIKNTYNHQNNNGHIAENGLWRSGNLCLSHNLDSLLHETVEPYDSEDKLLWNLQRAVRWVEAAANTNLVKEGDYYEVPQFVRIKPLILAYNEDSVSYMEWEGVSHNIGFLNIINVDDSQLYAENFYSLNGELCKASRWGDYVKGKARNTIAGAWILLNKEPVINIWQAPNLFSELADAMALQGRNLREDLRKVMPRFRDGKRHIIMVGFPVPEIAGRDNQLIHWEAFLLPHLSSGCLTRNGFRNTEKGWQARDFLEILRPTLVLEWLNCDNYSLREIQNRGHFDRKMTSKKYLIIGAGTLGASVGEMLVRSGVYNISIIDDDKYSIGNSARHILEVDSVGKFKADEVCKRFNGINPNVTASSINESLSMNNIGLIDSYDVIIDCTASNNVLSLLSSYTTHPKKHYFSISFGYKAENLFFSYQWGDSFDMSLFYNDLGNKIKKSEEAYMQGNLPWEGVGCWHPVFPAMAYDVQMAASVAIELISSFIESGKRKSQSYVFEKKYDQDGVVLGFARI